MRFLKLAPAAALLLFAGLFSAAPSAFAQYHFGYSQQRNIEVTGFAGGRFFGQIALPNSASDIDYLKIDNSYDYGVMGDVDLFGPLQAEFMWSRQPTSIESHDYTNGYFSPAGNVNIDNYQWSLVYQLRDSSARLRPYIAGGIGFTHWGTSVPQTLPFTNNVGFNVGGGVKYYFVKHVGVRVDFRWLPTRTTSQVGQFYDPYYGYYQANINNYAKQIQINGGLIFRF
ncbi:MAG: outer membrane beta-barrel protein [Candidatus Acidiferrales bacterium]